MIEGAVYEWFAAWQVCWRGFYQFLGTARAKGSHDYHVYGGEPPPFETE
jgi:hypothetical protein